MSKTSHHLRKTYKILSALMAFMLWGGWAYFVNDQLIDSHRLLVGLTQGTASFVITVLMVNGLTALYHFFAQSRLQFILPAVVTICITSSTLTIIHYLIGTPNIFFTIIPALSVAFAFCLLTTYQLRRQNI